MVFCAIAVPLTPGESYLSALRSLTEGLKSKFGVKGELSYSNLGKRREKVAQAVAEGLKRAGASVGYSSQHSHQSSGVPVDWSEARAQLAAEAVEAALSDLPLEEVSSVQVVMDVMPHTDKVSKALAEGVRRPTGLKVRVVARSSERVPGIQLADVLAGWIRRRRKVGR